MTWIRKETTHYVFNYHQGSLAEKNISAIITLQESSYDYICQILKVEINRRINYFLCNSPEEVGKMYGDNEPANGAVIIPNKIYAVYNEKVKCIGLHEDAHIISYNALGNPKQDLIREGLAMFFDKVWWGIPNEAWIKVFIVTCLYKNLSILIDNRKFRRIPETITYPTSGVFIHYLISVFGIEKFNKFYKTVDNNFHKSFQEIFGISLNEFENKMLDYIRDIEYHERIYDIIYSYLKEGKLLK